MDEAPIALRSASLAIVESAPEACTQHDITTTIDRFEWHMRNVPGVQSVLGIGLKISTLPVVALGVGIGIVGPLSRETPTSLQK